MDIPAPAPLLAVNAVGLGEPRGGGGMADIEPWWEAAEPLTAVKPGSATELVAVLDRLARLASQWSDMLDGLREATRQYGGPGAAVSFDVACRRSEQAFIELEIALRDARASSRNGH